MDKKTVVVGMSGGVDSSVAAWLLKEQGYRVIGVTMQIWQSEDPDASAAEGGCCGLSAVEDARRVADAIGIPHYVMSFRTEFKTKVIDYFTEEYLKGRTPNPCIACNRYVKWESLLRRSMEIGADAIATGHYARIRRLNNGRYSILTSAGMTKDQSYALYALTQDQLSRTLFPCGDYEKTQIREMARQAHLPVAEKPDSQEICFVPDGDYAGFIEKEAGDRTPPPGVFVDRDGRELGPHQGITHYTIGQRRGLGLPAGHRVYVTQIRPETGEVVIGENEDLFQSVVKGTDVCWMGMQAPKPGEEIPVVAKVRYNHPGERGILRLLEDGSVVCTFERPVRAPAPGQALVFYGTPETMREELSGGWAVLGGACIA
ncbi:MAG: tRNA 2-thiouridine(34) synthase MnmA [Lachnospiraceae bacterium]|nr:tRNA 2-thiouridine(34) synthase MnmA [Lachnospiraceae bacterium]